MYKESVKDNFDFPNQVEGVVVCIYFFIKSLLCHKHHKNYKEDYHDTKNFYHEHSVRGNVFEIF